MTLDESKRIIHNLIFSNFDKHEFTLKYRMWNIRLADVKGEDSIKCIIDRFYEEILKLDGISKES